MAALALGLTWTIQASAEDANDCSDPSGALLRSAPEQVVAACARLANLGDAVSQNRLGVLFSGGRAVPKDDTKAVEWWRRAADQGYVLAQFNIASAYFFGRGVPPDTTKAVEWYRRAADQGFARAQAVLGSLYRVGLGVPQDYVQSYVWFSLALAGGDAEVQRVRGETGKLLTAAELAEARVRTRAWQPSRANH